jgi:hypothetical protein
MLVTGTLVVAAAPAQAAAGGDCDFMGDGYPDVAVGVPGESVDMQVASGGVEVAYFAAGGRQRYVLTTSLPGKSLLGHALACGDFNGDGFDDLAAGAPAQQNWQGAVLVFAGSQSGLKHQQTLTPATFGAGATPFQHFGEALTSGDFNGDGNDDLAIGAPSKDVSAAPGGPYGTVYVVAGVTGQKVTIPAEDFDVGFGETLAARDINGDLRDDLAIGTPLSGQRQREGNPLIESGRVVVLPGHADRLVDTTIPWKLTQDRMGEETDSFDWFGGVLAFGDFNNDGDADLAVGAPGKDQARGWVYLVFNDGAWLEAAETMILKETTGEAKEIDLYGVSITTGQFDTFQGDDLAIGMLEIKTDQEYGAVELVRSNGSHVRVDVPSSVDDQRGFALGSTDYNADGIRDLIIGQPGATADNNQGAGSYLLIPGEPGGLAVASSMTFSENVGGGQYNEQAEDSEAVMSRKWLSHWYGFVSGERLGTSVAN